MWNELNLDREQPVFERLSDGVEEPIVRPARVQCSDGPTEREQL